MHKRRILLYLLSNILILLFGCSIRSLQASDQPEEEHRQVATVDANNASRVSSKTIANEIEELRELIGNQRSQMEKLQSAVDQQQKELDRTLIGPATGTATVQTPAGTSSESNPDSALQASNTSPAGNPSSAVPEQEAKPAGQSEAPKVELPDILKSFKPIGTFYISYQAGRKASGSPDSTTNYNSFLLKRGYFGAEVNLTSYLTGRFVSDVTLDSAGDVKLRAKYLYAKFHWKGNTVITKPYMEFGLAHMPWLDFEEALNGFRMQDTMFLERNHIFNSADVGVLVGSDLGGSLSSEYKGKVNSHYAGRYGSWQVGVYNGGGYHATEQNTNKVFEGRLSIRPIPDAVPGLQFSVFGIVGKGNKPDTDGINPPDWKSFNGMVSYESQYFTFTGQGYFGIGNQGGSALSPDGTAADQKGFSIFAAVHIPTPRLGEKITLLGRADEFNSDASIYNDLQRRYIAGIAFHLYKSNILLFDYERLNHSISTIPGEDRAQITMQVAF